MHILDYKSDVVANGDFDKKLQHYRLQLGAYAIGLKAALGEGPKSAMLYFFRYGETAKLEMTDKEIEKCREEIMRIVADIRAGRFERTAQRPCACGYEWLCAKTGLRK